MNLQAASRTTVDTQITAGGVKLTGMIFSDGTHSGWASPFRVWSIQHLTFECRYSGCGVSMKDYRIRPRYNLYHNSKFVADYATLENALKAIDIRKENDNG
jgi:hypothetical protein